MKQISIVSGETLKDVRLEIEKQVRFKALCEVAGEKYFTISTIDHYICHKDIPPEQC